MVHIEGEIVINRTPEEQKKCSTSSPMNATNPGTTRGCTSPRRYRTGRSVSAHASRAQNVSTGRPVDMAIEVTGYERPHRLGITTHMSSMDLHGGLTFDPAPDGTRMRWSRDFAAERHAQDAEPAGRQHGPAPGTDHLDRTRGSPGSTAELKQNGPGAPHPSDARPSDRSAQPR
jgi:hypothetical protein